MPTINSQSLIHDQQDINMDYRQLLLFLASADRLNLSQAAEAMSITQPGLSKSMHRLQRELGTRLYYRRGRGIELTESGRALAKHARLIESQLAEARSEVIGIAAGKGSFNDCGKESLTSSSVRYRKTG